MEEKLIQILLRFWDDQHFWLDTTAYQFLLDKQNQEKYDFEFLYDWETFRKRIYKPALALRAQIPLAEKLSQREYYASLLASSIGAHLRTIHQAGEKSDSDLYRESSQAFFQAFDRLRLLGELMQTAEQGKLDGTKALQMLVPGAKMFPHQAFVFEALQTEARRIVITMPPQHGKTTIILAYIYSLMLMKAGIRLAYISYSYTNTQNRLRPLIKAFENQGLQGEVWRKDCRQLKNGSTLFATSVDGTLTGEHLDVVIIDDPHKNYLEAVSKTKRDAVFSFYSNVVVTRGFEKLKVIFVGTRWHRDDLIGRVLASEKDVELYEMRALAESDDPLEREFGEPLCDYFMSRERLLMIRDLYPDMFEAQYQCRPRSQQDVIFVSEPAFYEELDWDRLVISIGVDLAYTQKNTSDYTALVVLGIEPEQQHFYLIEAHRWKEKIDRTIERIRTFSQKYKVPIQVESGGAQVAIVDLLRKEGLAVTPITPVGDKIARSVVFANAWNTGRFFLRRSDSPQLQEYIAEVMNFTGKGDLHDDFVDATVFAMQNRATRILFV